jgi:hydrogenase maturation protease
MKTIIIGLGNPILTDDGVGVKVADEVNRALAGRKPESVTVSEASVGGLRLMETLIGYDRAILIDAYINRNGNTPGKIHQMTLDDLRNISPTQHSTSAHDTSLVTALDLGNQMDLPLPKEITIFAVEVENVTDFSDHPIFAVEVENVTDFSDHPTACVSEAIPVVVEAVMKEIKINI